MSHEQVHQNRCCLIDLLPILKGRGGSDDCKVNIQSALRYIHKHMRQVNGEDDDPRKATPQQRYEKALAFKITRDELGPQVEQISALMRKGKFEEVTVLADKIIKDIAAEKDPAHRLLVFKRKFLPFMYALLELEDEDLTKVVEYNVKTWGIRPGTQILQVLVALGQKIPSWLPMMESSEEAEKLAKPMLRAIFSSDDDSVDDVSYIPPGVLQDGYRALLRARRIKAAYDAAGDRWAELKAKGQLVEEPPEHHAVYLGFGLVSEVGGSQWCKKEPGILHYLPSGSEFQKGTIAKVCLTLSTLHDFVTRAGNIPGGVAEIFRVEYAKPKF